jgi:hypothetical protein
MPQRSAFIGITLRNAATFRIHRYYNVLKLAVTGT